VFYNIFTKLDRRLNFWEQGYDYVLSVYFFTGIFPSYYPFALREAFILPDNALLIIFIETCNSNYFCFFIYLFICAYIFGLFLHPAPLALLSNPTHFRQNLFYPFSTFDEE
jgi:hypothetical protein